MSYTPSSRSQISTLPATAGRLQEVCQQLLCLSLDEVTKDAKLIERHYPGIGYLPLTTLPALHLGAPVAAPHRDVCGRGAGNAGEEVIRKQGRLKSEEGTRAVAYCLSR
jgi:hypothetical protein